MYRIATKKILSSFLLRGSHNVWIHAKHLVAHCNEDTGYFRSFSPFNFYIYFLVYNLSLFLILIIQTRRKRPFPHLDSDGYCSANRLWPRSRRHCDVMTSLWHHSDITVPQGPVCVTGGPLFLCVLNPGAPKGVSGLGSHRGGEGKESTRFRQIGSSGIISSEWSLKVPIYGWDL